MKAIFLRIFSVVILLGLLGCGTLDKTGPYKGDKALYDADQTIVTSASLFQTFASWEYENRAALAKYPDIKAYADRVRLGAPQWTASALKARDVYATTGTPENRDILATAIAVLKTAVKEIGIYTAKAAL